MLIERLKTTRTRVQAGRRAATLRYTHRWSQHDLDIGDTGHIAIGDATSLEPGYLTKVHGDLTVGVRNTWRVLDRLVVERGAQMVVGDGVIIEAGAQITVRGQLSIADNVYVGKDCVIGAYERVEIGDGTLLGERVSIHDENHGPAPARMNMRTSPIVIGRRVWLGAGVVVTAGSAIGDGATVGANAVVTRHIEPGLVAGGIPAQILRVEAG